VKSYIFNSKLLILNNFVIKNTKFMKKNKYMKIYPAFRPGRQDPLNDGRAVLELHLRPDGLA
jgi:hypothetical protein